MKPAFMRSLFGGTEQHVRGFPLPRPWHANPLRDIRLLGAGVLLLTLGLSCIDSGVSPLLESVEVTRVPYATTADPDTALADSQICSGDVVKVEVTPKVGAITRIDINGYPGETRYIQFRGFEEELDIAITASVIGHGRDVVLRTVEIMDCVRPYVPNLRSQPSLYEPFEVDFIVTNQDELGGGSWQKFYWNFGDGTPEVDTARPYVRHSYESVTDGREMYESFEVTLSNAPADVVDPSRLTRKHQISVLDYTRIALQKGIIQPRAWATEPLEIADGKLIGHFRIRNTRSEPLLLTHAMEEQQPCANLAEPIRSDMNVADILFQGGYDDYQVQDDDDFYYYQDAMTYASALENQPSDGFVVRPSPDTLTLLSTLGSPIALPAIDPSILGSLVIPNRSVHEASFKFDAADYGEDICVLSYHFRGISGGGFPVVASLHYELRPDPAETETLAEIDPIIPVLEHIIAQGWVSNAAEITSEDLFRLQQQGRIRQIPSGWEIVSP